jgi:O-antigen/teichoic acid export membrane protein
VGVRLLTRFLDPGVYGQLALGMTVATLAQQTILGPLGSASLRFFAPAREAAEMSVYLRAVAKLGMYAGGTVLGTGLLLIPLLSSLGQQGSKGLWLVAVVYSVVAGSNSVLDGMQNAARQRIVVAWHQAMSQWLRFLLAAALVSMLGKSASAAMAGYALASLAVAGSQVLFFRQLILPLTRHERPIRDGMVGEAQREMIRYAWPFAIWGVFTWMQLAADRWALETFRSSHDVGLYQAIYQVGYYPLSILSTVLAQLISPMLFARAGDGSDPKRLLTAGWMNAAVVVGMLGLTLVATAATFFYHAQLMALVTAPEYRVASPFLWLLVLSGGLFASGQTASLLLLTTMASKRLVAPKIVTAVLGAVATLLGARAFGIRGVVWAGLLFSVVYAVWVSALSLVQISQLRREFRG